MQKLLFLVIISAKLIFYQAHVAEGEPAVTLPGTVPKEVAENPSYWLKNTHSTSCKHSSVRTFKVDSLEGEPLSLIIRQDVQVSKYNY